MKHGVTEHIYRPARCLTSIITFGPQPNKAIVGENAFAHEAGIHQDGDLKEKSTYEIIDPAECRRSGSIVDAGQAQWTPRAERPPASIWVST